MLRETVPTNVEHALAKALAKSPADRFATALEFAKALQVADTAVVTKRMPVLPVRTVVAAFLVISISMGGALWIGGRRDAKDEEYAVAMSDDSALPHSRSALAVLPFQDLSTDPAHAYFAAGLHDELLTQLFKVARSR